MIRLLLVEDDKTIAGIIKYYLTEEEETVYRHGRNAKPKTVPKSATVAEYAHATALEALFGWLYLKQRYDRINELFGRIAETF